MVVRWAVGVGDLSWRLSLALFGIRLAARLPVRAGNSGRVLNPYLAGLLNFSIYQSQAPAVGKNLSSLCRTKSVLLRARLFPRWRRASRISSRRRSIGEGFTQIGTALTSQGITHLMVREDLLGEFLNHNLTPAQRSRLQDFASRRLQPLFRDQGYSLYQLHG